MKTQQTPLPSLATPELGSAEAAKCDLAWRIASEHPIPAATDMPCFLATAPSPSYAAFANALREADGDSWTELLAIGFAHERLRRARPYFHLAQKSRLGASPFEAILIPAARLHEAKGFASLFFDCLKDCSWLRPPASGAQRLLRIFLSSIGEGFLPASALGARLAAAAIHDADPLPEIFKAPPDLLPLSLGELSPHGSAPLALDGFWIQAIRAYVGWHTAPPPGPESALRGSGRLAALANGSAEPDRIAKLILGEVSGLGDLPALFALDLFSACSAHPRFAEVDACVGHLVDAELAKPPSSWLRPSLLPAEMLRLRMATSTGLASDPPSARPQRL